ncbi:hypothetical protein Ancab_030216, partial [Ancistrocladus abbreviatus]
MKQNFMAKKEGASSKGALEMVSRKEDNAWFKGSYIRVVHPSIDFTSMQNQLSSSNKFGCEFRSLGMDARSFSRHPCWRSLLHQATLKSLVSLFGRTRWRSVFQAWTLGLPQSSMWHVVSRGHRIGVQKKLRVTGHSMQQRRIPEIMRQDEWMSSTLGSGALGGANLVFLGKCGASSLFVFLYFGAWWRIGTPGVMFLLLPRLPRGLAIVFGESLLCFGLRSVFLLGVFE